MRAIYKDPDVTWVAITGGPCSGKSTSLTKMRQRLEGAGIRVVSVQESATRLILGGLGPFMPWRDPVAFQRHVLRGINWSEKEAYEAARDLEPAQHTVFLCDRGALDGIAYAGRNNFLEMIGKDGYAFLELQDRYQMVIHLVTAAEGAEEYYTLANNEARSETPEQARDLDRRTREAWYGHQHLRVIDNSTSFDEKVRRAFNELARVLHMPEAHERERKFVIINTASITIPDNAVRVRITQDYLTSSEPGLERRVRKRELGGATTFFSTEKRNTGTVGDRVEKEDPIDPSEYRRLIQHKEPGLETIMKDRSTYLYGSRYLEHDQFINPTYLDWLQVLEVEVPDLSEVIEFPPGFELVEVTNDQRFSNYAIATGSLRYFRPKDLLFLPHVA